MQTYFKKYFHNYDIFIDIFNSRYIIRNIRRAYEKET
nr:MAG TPA: hypothetical protein [Caudoviricetes sp.]